MARNRLEINDKTKPADQVPPANPAPSVVVAAGPEESPSPAPAPGDDAVTISVPKAFKFRVDNHRILDIPAGTQKIAKVIADMHAWQWWSKAHGVTVVPDVVPVIGVSAVPEAPAVPEVPATPPTE